MIWLVQLSGEVVDLQALSRSFSDDKIRILAEEDNYFLESKNFAGATTSEEVLEKAKDICGIVSGVARLAYGARSVVKPEHIYRLHPDGRRDVFVIIKEGIEVRESVGTVTVITSDGSEVAVETPDPARRWIDIAETNDSVSKALRLFGSDAKDWVGLYRLYEVIEQDMGGMKHIVAAGWTTEVTLRLFKHTANSPAAIGDMARHGKETAQPPKNPMDLSEARSLIEVLLHSWIREKNNSNA